MKPVWPSYGRIQHPVSREPREHLNRTEMETGPPKQSTKGEDRQLVHIDLAVFYSAEEYQNWLTWYRDEISRGSLWFEFPDFDGVTRDARIVGGRYNARTTLTGEGGPVGWTVSLQLEVYDA